MEMAHRRESTGVEWANALEILVAVWLIVSPWVAGYVYGAAPSVAIEASLWVNVVAGLTLAVLAIVRLTVRDAWTSITWLTFVVGGFLIVSPWIFRYSMMPRAVYTDIFTGVVVIGLAAWSGASSIAFRTRG